MYGVWQIPPDIGVITTWVGKIATSYLTMVKLFNLSEFSYKIKYPLYSYRVW